jgi:hypothetical protein
MIKQLFRIRLGVLLSLAFFMSGHADAQSRLLPHMRSKDSSVEKLIFFSTTKPTKPELPVKIRQDNHTQDVLFYWIIGMFFLLGMVRTLYGKFMENFLKVVFNSTLRQSQLVEQLNQSARPSFYLNLLFLFAFSTYLCLLIAYQYLVPVSLNLFLLCFLFVLVSYLVKSGFIKLLGWISGYVRAAGNYLSILLLMNKATGLVCLIWIFFFAFSPASVKPVLGYASLITLALMVVVRYMRTYGTVHYDLSLSRTQFFLYLLCMELIPILLLYKCFMQFFIKMQ